MKIIKKYKYHILSFIIPLFLCVIFFSMKGIITNVELFFVSDLKDQHLAFFQYLKNVMLGYDSIYYSYYAGLGSPMISALSFYVVSPINIMLIIIKDIRYAIFSIYILKICLSGLMMFIFLSYKSNKRLFIALIFSICYAMSSYAMNFFLSIFWLDVLYLAPLVLLGIDKLFIEEKFNLIYILSLSLTIICNIQIGFGLCIFSVIYFIYSYNIKYDIKKNRDVFVRLSIIFLISSLCVGAISSGFIMAFLSGYNNTNIARNVGVSSYSRTGSIDYIIKNIFSIGKVKTLYYNEYEPLIYCGLIVTILSILYLFDKDIDKKLKKHTIIVIVIFIISFIIKPLNVFWHLSQPILLNYRYSIYLSLFLVLISYEYYLRKGKFIRKDYFVLCISILVGVIFSFIYKMEINLLWSIVYLLLISILLVLSKNVSIKFELLLFVVILFELTSNAYLSFYSIVDLPFGLTGSYSGLKTIANLNKFSNNYRVSYDYTYTGMLSDGFLINKNSSPRYFSSVINGNINRFMFRNLASNGKNHYSLSSYDSPLLVSLLGNKYFYLLDDVDSGLYKKINTYNIRSYDYEKKKVNSKKVYLYENPYALSIGYVVDKDAKYKKGDSLVDYQNRIINSFISSDKKVMNKVDIDKNSINGECADGVAYCNIYTIDNSYDNDYMYFYAPFYSFASEYKMDIYYGSNGPLLIHNDDKSYDVTVNDNKKILDNLVFAATYNKENLIESLKQLQLNMLEDVKINKNILKASINSNKDGILFISIPYDNKFTIFVDGKKAKYYPMIDNTFIGIDISEGKHNIKMIYVDSDLKWYIISSIVSIIVTLVVYIYSNKRLIDK
ncbi:MAG: YfhO family protein [Bacilli bacterium]|nr:YfhO family protein [Bacilli bacterium]